jgi:hypothetical protein
VRLLNDTELRYTWPRYLQSRGRINDFFDDLEKDVIQLLWRSLILQSINGDMAMPSTLTVVPEDYLDGYGSPLTLTKITGARYLCSQYSRDDWAFLGKLGVQEMHRRQFFEEMEACIADSGFLDERPMQWHSCLAQRLLAILSSDGSWLDTIREWPVIPLTDGSWTNAKATNLCFSSDTENFVVPGGIEFSQVQNQASSDPYRRQLLVLLGVQPFDSSRVCQIIADKHRDISHLYAASMRAEDVIQHGLFVFRAGWIDPRGGKLWFVGSRGKHALYERADELFVRSAADLFTHLGLEDLKDQVTFLHPGYEKHLDNDVDGRWDDWLATCQGMNRFPRLVRPVDPQHDDDFDVSPEFEYIMRSQSPSRALHVLKSQWSHYSIWVEERHGRDRSNTWDRSRRALVLRLSIMEVDCRHKRKVRLKDTVFPWSAVTNDLSIDLQIAILNLPNTESEGEWDFLRMFGVGSKAIVDVWFKHLRLIREGGTPERISTETMARLYRELHQCRNEGGVMERIKSILPIVRVLL